jgi:hypothetical protein
MKVRLKYLGAAFLLVSATTFATLFHAATSDAAGDNCTISATLVNSCRPLFGATVGGYTQTASDNASQYAYGEQRLNNPNVLTDPSSPTTVTNQYDVIHRYHSPTQTSFDANETSYYNRDNTYLYINWKPDTIWTNADGDNTTVNDHIDQMADSIKGLGDKKIFLTVFHEPENDVSSGNCTTNGGSAAAGSPTDYVNMWHNVRSRFDAKGVTNVVWTMNYMGYQAWNCLVPLLWPGNSYVDWVTYDPYGGGTSSSTLFNDSVSPFYNYLSQNSDSTHDYLSKPWGLAEQGAWANGGTNQAGAIDYWNQAANAITNNTYPNLKMFLTFDTSVNGTSQVGTDFNGQPSTTEQTAYNNFASTVFNTDYTAPAPVLPAITSVTPGSGTLTGSKTFTVATNDVVTSVAMSVDGQLVNTDSSAPFSFTLDTNNYTNGNHTFTFLAKDAAGNSATTTVTYNVLNTPLIYSVTPGSGTIKGTQTFAVSTNKEVTSVTIRVDDKWVATDNSAPWSLSINTKNYKNGTHAIGIKAWDDNGKYYDKVINFTVKN